VLLDLGDEWYLGPIAVWSEETSEGGRRDRIATHDANRGLRVWDMETGACVRILELEGVRALAAAGGLVPFTTEEGHYRLISTSVDGIMVWDLGDGRLIERQRSFLEDARVMRLFESGGEGGRHCLMLTGQSHDGLGGGALEVWDLGPVPPPRSRGMRPAHKLG
jgi:hypothetical protein